MQAGEGRRDALLRGCLKRLNATIDRSIEPGFKRAGEELVTAAKHPTDAALRTEALNGLHAIEGRQGRFQETLVRECDRLLDQPSFTDPAAALPTRRSRGLLPTGEGLSLLDEQSLENTVAVESFVARAEARYAQELYALSSRLSLILNRQIEELTQCPLGPTAIAGALARAIGALQLPAPVAPIFAEGFCGAFLSELADFYLGANDDLAAAGILPNLKYKRINRGSSERREEGRGAVRPEEQPRGEEHQKSRATGESAERVQEIRQLLSEVMPAPLGDPDGHRAGPEAVDRALARLQTDLAMGQLDGALKGEALKERLLEAISESDYGGESVQLNDRSSQTIEIMSRLFEFVDKQRQLNGKLAELVGRLQVPLYRVAINNEELLTSEKHPARRFFNALAASGRHWSEDDRRDARMIKKMERVVERAVSEYDGEDELFEELFEDLSSQIEVSEKRARLAERRNVDAARGLEKLKLSQKRASNYVGEVLGKYRLEEEAVPRNFLRQPWCDYLTLLLLRDSAEHSKEFQQACLAAETLGVHNREGLSEMQLEKLLGRRRALESIVGRGVSQIGFSDAARVELWDNLVGWMDVRIAHRSSCPEVEPIVLPERPRFLEALQALPSRVPSLSQSQKQVLAHLRQVPFGTWFEFLEDNALRKLAWFSTVSNHALFVNNRGSTVLETTLQELAVWVESKQATVFRPPAKPLFDRALEAIQNGLRKIRDGLSGGGGEVVPV